MKTRDCVSVAVLVLATTSLAGCPTPNTAPDAVTPILDSVTWQGWPHQDGSLPTPIPATQNPNGAYSVLPAYRVHIWVTGPMLGSTFDVSYNGQALPLVVDPTLQAQNNSGWFNFGLNNAATKWDIVIGVAGDNSLLPALCSGGSPSAIVAIYNRSQGAAKPLSGTLTVALGPDGAVLAERDPYCYHVPPVACAPPYCCDGRKCCGGPGNYYACGK